MATKFLYGASVQGIQSFIFQTNELKDIIGASELVNQICTTEFSDFEKNGEKVVGAAGNIKYIFDNREDCERAVLEFPKHVMELAPGITISQAVVEMKDEFADFGKAVNELERKLRIQRNRPIPSLSLGLMATERYDKTGMPAAGKDKEGNLVDISTLKKLKAGKEKDESGKTLRSRLCDKAFGEYVKPENYPFDISNITLQNEWIAVIHADGNGLGKIIQNIGDDKDLLKAFSSKLDNATENAAKDAFNTIKSTYGINEEKKVPVRPVVIGGDDFTVICRADFAVEYTAAYIKAFEEQTKKKLGDILNSKGLQENLTACAGIAFIKSSYPFYYGYNLAEELCSAAKKDAKEFNKDFAPSCLMFHKVQDSFVVDYKDITKRELIPGKDMSWKFGPYYIKDDIAVANNRWTVDKLIHKVIILDSEKDGNAVKSAIREWMTEMHNNPASAEQLLMRAKQIYKKESKEYSTLEDATSSSDRKYKDSYTGKEKFRKTYPAYDILSLLTVINQKTK